MGFQFLVFYAGICFLIVLLALSLNLLSVNWREKVANTIWSLAFFAHVLLPMRCLQENFLKMLVSVVIEINYLIGKYGERRQLEYNAVQITGLALSIFILVFSFITQHLFIGFAIKKWKDENSKMNKIIDGLNLENRKCIVLYFVHFYLTWILIAFLIFLTPYLKSSSKYLILVFAAY